jgi:hypothetical protein
VLPPNVNEANVVWVKAPDHVKPVPGTSYDDVPTTRLPPPSPERVILGPRRPTAWVLQKMDGGRGPDRGVIHAVDCEEAPAGALADEVLEPGPGAPSARRPG